MGIRILVADCDPVALSVDGVMQHAVLLRDVGKPSEAVDATVAKSSHAWVDREMPGAAVLPDGHVIRWEPGLVRVADADLARHPSIGQLSLDGDPPVLLHHGGIGRWSLVEAQVAGILDAEGRLTPWRRPRITGIVRRESTRIVSPNASSSGPVVRSFATFRTKMSDGSEEDLVSYWHVPPDYAAEADDALPGLALNEAFEWLSAPLKRRAQADARVLCAGGSGLTFLIGDVRLELRPAPDGEIMFVEGNARHLMAAGPAIEAVGDRAATLDRGLVLAGGKLCLEVLGLEGVIVMEVMDAGMRLTCRTSVAIEIMDIPVRGFRKHMADLSSYLAACGDLSVKADATWAAALPTFGPWMVVGEGHPSN